MGLKHLHVKLERFLQVELRYPCWDLSFYYLYLLRRLICLRWLIPLIFRHVLVHLKALTELFHVVLQLVVPPLELLYLMNIVCVPTTIALLWGPFSRVSGTAIDTLTNAEGPHLALKGAQLRVELLIL